MHAGATLTHSRVAPSRILKRTHKQCINNTRNDIHHDATTRRRDTSTDTAPTTRGEDQQTTERDALTRGDTPRPLQQVTDGQVDRGSTSAATSTGDGGGVVLWCVDQQK